jgi:hypothetical protein
MKKILIIGNCKIPTIHGTYPGGTERVIDLYNQYLYNKVEVNLLSAKGTISPYVDNIISPPEKARDIGEIISPFDEVHFHFPIPPYLRPLLKNKEKYDFKRFHIFHHTCANATFPTRHLIILCDQFKALGAKLWYNSDFCRRTYLEWLTLPSRLSFLGDYKFLTDLQGDIFPIFYLKEQQKVLPHDGSAVCLSRMNVDRAPQKAARILMAYNGGDSYFLTNSNRSNDKDWHIEKHDKLINKLKSRGTEVYIDLPWQENQNYLQKAKFAIFTKPDESFGLAIAEAHSYGCIPIVVAPKYRSPAHEHSPDAFVFSKLREAIDFINRYDDDSRETRAILSYNLNSFKKFENWMQRNILC